MSHFNGAADSVPAPEAVQAIEQNVVGAVLRDPSILGELTQLIQPEDFESFVCRSLFDAAMSLWLDGKPVDPGSVYDLAVRRGLRQDIHPIDIFKIHQEWWSAKPVYYAKQIRANSLIRRLRDVGQEIKELAESRGGSAEDLLAEAERKVMSLSLIGATGATVTLEEAICEELTRLDALRSGNARRGIASGFVDLDAVLGGFQDSELIIVAARPSVGKTAFGLNVARHAILDNIPVFIASLEMSKQELSGRILCDYGRINSHQYRKPELMSDADALRLSQAASDLREKQLHIDDQAGQSMLRITANARRLKHRHVIRLVIVDYLQLIEPEDRRVPRHEQVAAISRRLKQLARELNLPVVVMAQLNRGTDEFEEPRLADLRESGAIEQDADVVLMLYKPQKDEPRMVAMKIAKNRNGPRDTVPLTFAAEYMRFETYDSLPRVP